MSKQNGEGSGPKERPNAVISLEEYRRRRYETRPQNAESRSRLVDPSRQRWQAELAEAMDEWLPQDPAAANREYYTIESRLQVHPPVFRELISYLAAHHPLAAQLMMLRHDLLAENSILQRNPMLREQRADAFYSAEELAENHEKIWLRYVQRLRYDEARFSLYDVPLSSPEFFERHKACHPALIAVLLHPDLPTEIFMPLIQSLEIFPSLRSSE